MFLTSMKQFSVDGKIRWLPTSYFFICFQYTTESGETCVREAEGGHGLWCTVLCCGCFRWYVDLVHVSQKRCWCPHLYLFFFLVRHNLGSSSIYFLFFFPSVFWGEDVGKMRDQLLCVFCVLFFFYAFWFGLNIVDTKSFCFLVPLMFRCYFIFTEIKNKMCILHWSARVGQ